MGEEGVVMADAKAWADLARAWLAASSPETARAMREQELEAARRRRDRRPVEPRRGAGADRAAEEALARVRWATEPEAAGPSEEEIEAARAVLAREVVLARARARAHAEREGR
ncbi:hypothetical protein HII36_21785 [Nonomuraea sp. NN258]|uniref:hypothetical protein n=1 Tax=Nonomuraea antri TaxID=2730852 RepID=UPI00156A0606|nr:hypothetical protein [Nonomuraea antri]NRQ34465.1 hypothetical protein [Nonomuraea antri]